MRYSNAQIMRGKAGLSQTKASKTLGISRAYLSQLETHKHPMNDDVKAKMARLYQCHVSELLG